jgi:hypothetical protein
MQLRGSAGEHSEADGGKYDISNRERMGLTEFQVRERKGLGYGKFLIKIRLLNLIFCYP